jgi:hypothetical protein
MPEFGIKVSKPGYDVKSASPENLVLLSSQNLFKVKQEGAFSITVPANTGYAETTIVHNLGYIPAVFAYIETTYGESKKKKIPCIGDGAFEMEISTTNVKFRVWIPTAGVKDYDRTYNGYYYICLDPIA